jgi:hypothetical protein
MATCVETGPEQNAAYSETSLTRLVTGIIDDTQALIKQQVALLKHEIKEDLQRTKEATIAFSLGLPIMLIGGLLFCFALVYLLNWALPNVLPLWGCYAIVGGLAVACGGAFLYASRQKIASIKPLHDQTMAALKENVRWIKRAK